MAWDEIYGSADPQDVVEDLYARADAKTNNVDPRLLLDRLHLKTGQAPPDNRSARELLGQLQLPGQPPDDANLSARELLGRLQLPSSAPPTAPPIAPRTRPSPKPSKEDSDRLFPGTPVTSENAPSIEPEPKGNFPGAPVTPENKDKPPPAPSPVDTSAGGSVVGSVLGGAGLLTPEQGAIAQKEGEAEARATAERAEKYRNREHAIDEGIKGAMKKVLPESVVEGVYPWLFPPIVNEPKEYEKAIEAKKKTPTQTYWRDKIERAVPSVADTIIEGLATAARLAMLVPTGADTTGAQEKISALKEAAEAKVSKEWFKADPSRDKEFGSQLEQGIGSSAAFILGGAAGKAAGASEFVVTGILGALPQGEQQYAQAEALQKINPAAAKVFMKEHYGLDVSEKTANEIAKWGMLGTGLLGGSTEALPMGHIFQRIEQASHGGLSHLMRLAAEQGGEEAAQEALQQVLQNASTWALLDRNQELTEDVVNNAFIGFLTGHVMTTALGGAGMLLSRQPPSPPGASPAPGGTGAPPAAGATPPPPGAPAAGWPSGVAPPWAAGTPPPAGPAPPSAPPAAPQIDPQQLAILQAAGLTPDDVAALVARGPEALEEVVKQATEAGFSTTGPPTQSATKPAPPPPDVDATLREWGLDPTNWSPDEKAGAFHAAVQDGASVIPVQLPEQIQQQHDALFKAMSEDGKSFDVTSILSPHEVADLQRQGVVTDGKMTPEQLKRWSNLATGRVLAQQNGGVAPQAAPAATPAPAQEQKPAETNPSEQRHPRYDEALALVSSSRNASTSFIQRKLGLGYPEIQRIMEQLEDAGVVSKPNKNSKREVIAQQPKRSINIRGLPPIVLEVEKGGTREGKTPSGKTYRQRVGAHYGYFEGLTGNDGQNLDVFVGDHPENGKLFVLDEKDRKTGAWRQHKFLAGFENEAEARKAYLGTQGKSEKGIGAITPMSHEEFDRWRSDTENLKRPVTQAPSAETGAAPAEAQSAETGAAIQEMLAGDEAAQEHVAQVEGVLRGVGMDPANVLPADIARAAEAMAQNPDLDPAVAFIEVALEDRDNVKLPAVEPKAEETATPSGLAHEQKGKPPGAGEAATTKGPAAEPSVPRPSEDLRPHEAQQPSGGGEVSAPVGAEKPRHEGTKAKGRPATNEAAKAGAERPTEAAAKHPEQERAKLPDGGERKTPERAGGNAGKRTEPEQPAGHTPAAKNAEHEKLLLKLLAHPDVAEAITNTVVNRAQDVPYTAGPDKTGPGLNIDKHFPKSFTIEGKTFDPAKPFARHEFPERNAIERLIASGWTPERAYTFAHWEVGERSEGLWYEEEGIDRAAAEKAYQPFIDKIEHEKLAKGDGNVPENLYRRPYPEGSVDAAAREKSAVPRPTAKEIAKGWEVLAQKETQKAEAKPVTLSDLTKAADEIKKETGFGTIPIKDLVARAGVPFEQAKPVLLEAAKKGKVSLHASNVAPARWNELYGDAQIKVEGHEHPFVTAVFKGKPAAPKQETKQDQSALRQRIIGAYSDLVKGDFTQWVRLANLRRALPEVSRELLDHELLRMHADPEFPAQLSHEDNGRAITDADRASEIKGFGDPMHIIWISKDPRKGKTPKQRAPDLKGTTQASRQQVWPDHTQSAETQRLVSGEQEALANLEKELKGVDIGGPVHPMDLTMGPLHERLPPQARAAFEVWKTAQGAVSDRIDAIDEELKQTLPADIDVMDVALNPNLLDQIPARARELALERRALVGVTQPSRIRQEMRMQGPITTAAQARDAINHVINKLVGKNIDIVLSDMEALTKQIDPNEGWAKTSLAKKSKVMGSYTGRRLGKEVYRGIIKVALDGVNVGRTVFHEAFHAFEDMLATDQELKLFARETERLRHEYVAVSRPDLTKEDIAALGGDEVRAISAEHYLDALDRGEDPRAHLHIGFRRFFDKIATFIRKLRNALHRLGFKTSEDVFKALSEGEVGGRELRATGGREFMDALEAKEPSDLTQANMMDLARRFRVNYAKIFAPDEISTRALDALPQMVKYKSATAQEKDAIVVNEWKRWKYWNRLPAPERIDFLHRMETGQPQRNAIEQAMADDWKQLFADNWAQEKAWGSMASYIQDYVPHIWKVPPQGGPTWASFVEAKTRQLGPTWFQKARLYNTIQEGLSAKLELKNTNPADIMTHRLLAGADMRLRMQLLYDLHRQGLAWEGIQGGQMLMQRGWQAVNAPDRRQWMLHPDILPYWKNAIADTGLWGLENGFGGAFRGWMMLKAIWVPIKLALSAFHPLHVLHINQANSIARGLSEIGGGDVVRGIKDIFSGILTVPTLGALEYRFGKQAQQAWKKQPADQNADERDMVTLMNEGGFSPQLDERLRVRATKSFLEAWHELLRRENLASAVPRALWHGFREAMAIPQHSIFEKWIPALKAAAYLKEAARVLRQDPSLLLDQDRRGAALHAVARSVDNRFGEMFYSNLHWNKALKDSAIASFLSLGWNLGFVREFGGAAAETLTRPARAVGLWESPELRKDMLRSTNKIKFAISYVTTAALINWAMSNALGGPPPDDPDDPRHLKDLVFARIGGKNPDGTPRRVTNMFYLREIPMLMKHIEERGGNVPMGIWEMIYNKMMIQPMVELINNKNYWRNEIYDTNAPWYKQMWQMAKNTIKEQASPIAVSGASRAAELSGAPPVNSLLDVPGAIAAGTKGVGLSMLGFGPAPAYIDKTPFENRVGYLFGLRNPGAKPYEEGEEKSSTAKYRARTAILVAKQSGDSAALTEARKAGQAAGLTVNYMNNLGKTPTSVYLFSRLSSPDQRYLLGGASVKDREKYLLHAHREVQTEFYRARPEGYAGEPLGWNFSP